MCEILCHCVKHCFPVWSIVPLRQIICPYVKYVSLCQILCHCVKYCSCVKHCATVSNIMSLYIILCTRVKYCATLPNIVYLCKILCHCVKYHVPVSNVVPLCQTCFLTFLFFSATRCSKKRVGCWCWGTCKQQNVNSWKFYLSIKLYYKHCQRHYGVDCFNLSAYSA